MQKTIASLLLLATLGLAGTASAQTPGGCQNDVRTYCGKSNGNAVTECLLDHQQDISDQCYDNLKQQLKQPEQKPSTSPTGGRAPGAAQACKTDAEKLCNGTQPGGGRIVRCLMEHQKELSDGCYDLLASRKKKS